MEIYVDDTELWISYTLNCNILQVLVIGTDIDSRMYNLHALVHIALKMNQWYVNVNKIYLVFIIYFLSYQPVSTAIQIRHVERKKITRATLSLTHETCIVYKQRWFNTSANKHIIRLF